MMFHSRIFVVANTVVLYYCTCSLLAIRFCRRFNLEQLSLTVLRFRSCSESPLNLLPHSL